MPMGKLPVTAGHATGNEQHVKISNDLKLPEPLVQAVRNDPYDREDADYTPTSLIRPVRIASLTRKWDASMIEDASERIFALLGQAVHTIMERAATDRYIVEKRFFWVIGGKKIGGKIDIYDRKTQVLSNYKICSRYVVNDGVKPEWQAQASIEAWLMQRNEYPVKGYQIVAIFRDWSKLAAERKNDYPDRQVAILPVTLWDTETTETYIRNRITAHELGRDNPPVCTPEERWERPAKWALMRKGQKRAIKLFGSEIEALAATDGPSEKYIQPRPGENVRCLHYCPVVSYCNFGRELVREAAGQ